MRQPIEIIVELSQAQEKIAALTAELERSRLALDACEQHNKFLQESNVDLISRRSEMSVELERVRDKLTAAEAKARWYDLIVENNGFEEGKALVGIAQLKEERDALREQVVRLEADGKRLDWLLFFRGVLIRHINGTDVTYSVDGVNRFETEREAIDAAIAETALDTKP